MGAMPTNVNSFVERMRPTDPVNSGMSSISSMWSSEEISVQNVQGFCVGDCVQCFNVGTPEQIKWDIMDSVLLAQLHANREYDKYQYPDKWFQIYASVLNTIGWDISSFNFQEIQRESDQIYNFMLNAARDVCADYEIELIISYVNSLTLEKNKSALDLWNHSAIDVSKTRTGGICNIAVASLDQEIPVLKLSAFYLTNLTENLLNSDCFLFEKWSSDQTQIFNSTQIIRLDENIYSRIRDTVKSKLVGFENRYIIGLEI